MAEESRELGAITEKVVPLPDAGVKGETTGVRVVVGAASPEVEDTSVEAGSAPVLSPVLTGKTAVLDVQVSTEITISGEYEVVETKPLLAGRLMEASAERPVVTPV